MLDDKICLSCHPDPARFPLPELGHDKLRCIAQRDVRAVGELNLFPLSSSGRKIAGWMLRGCEIKVAADYGQENERTRQRKSWNRSSLSGRVFCGASRYGHLKPLPLPVGIGVNVAQAQEVGLKNSIDLLIVYLPPVAERKKCFQYSIELCHYSCRNVFRPFATLDM